MNRTCSASASVKARRIIFYTPTRLRVGGYMTLIYGPSIDVSRASLSTTAGLRRPTSESQSLVGARWTLESTSDVVSTCFWRAISVLPGEANNDAIRRYFVKPKSKTQRKLREKSVVLIWPQADAGQVVWTPEAKAKARRGRALP